MLKKPQLRKYKISNSSKTWSHRENLTTVLKSAPQNYPENDLKSQTQQNSFKIVELWIADIKNELSNLLPELIHTIIIFPTLFEAWDPRCSSNSDLGRAQNSLVTTNLAILVQAFEVFI